VKTGSAILLLAGVGAAGGAGYLLWNRGALGGLGIPAPAPAPAAAGAASSAAPRSTPSAVTQLANGLQAVNQAGCTAIASAAGKLPTGIAATGCAAYTKYLSPIGATQALLGVAEKIPIVGGGVKTVENAVSKVVSKPISAVKNLLGGLF